MRDHIADLIYSNKRTIAERVVALQYQQHPELEARFGKEGREKCRQDTEYHCLYLAEAIRFEEEGLFLDYLAWTKVFQVSLGLKAQDLESSLRTFATVLKEELPLDCYQEIARFLDPAVGEVPKLPHALPSFVRPEAPHGKLAQNYLNCLLARDTVQADRVVLNAKNAGLPLVDLYDHVLSPCLHEVGRLWQTHKINEAQEHYCTETTHTLLAVLSAEFRTGKVRKAAVGFCVANENHSLGIRMALDCFALEGWDTVNLGGNVPTDNIPTLLELWQPDVVLLSVTMIYHLSEAVQAITAIHQAPTSKKPLVIVGGHPFELSPDLWRKVGADRSGGTCLEVQRLAKVI